MRTYCIVASLGKRHIHVAKICLGQTKPMGVICHWCRQRIGNQVSLVNQDVLALAQAKTSMTINKNAVPGFHVFPPYTPFHPPLMFRNCAV